MSFSIFLIWPPNRPFSTPAGCHIRTAYYQAVCGPVYVETEGIG
jgi:hypothetical protein